GQYTLESLAGLLAQHLPDDYVGKIKLVVCYSGQTREGGSVAEQLASIVNNERRYKNLPPLIVQGMAAQATITQGRIGVVRPDDVAESKYKELKGAELQINGFTKIVQLIKSASPEIQTQILLGQDFFDKFTNLPSTLMSLAQGGSEGIISALQQRLGPANT